jgi:cytochrome c peroxidase
MKTNPLSVLAIIAASLISPVSAEDGVLDLTQLANYANQTRPAYITKNNTTPGNAITNKGATLGRVLFHDKRLSKNDTISCSSCHHQSRAFADTATASVGVNGSTGRHSMRLVNARFATEAKFFWDERAATLEAQTTQPIQDHVEMGFSGTLGDPAFAALVTKLSAIDEYRVLFTMAFGNQTINEARVQLALAQFIRSIQSFDSKYDEGRTAAGNDNAIFPLPFTAAENAGKALFMNPPAPPGQPQTGAGCVVCHRSPEFDIDPNSRNNGVITKIGGNTDITNTRSPSLRDMVGPNDSSNGAFMHDGSFATIAQVINHYNLIPGNNNNLDPRLQRPGGQVQSLGLSDTQKSNLAAFLRTLTGTAIYTDEKWSDPFNANGELTLIILPAEQITIVDNKNGTATVSCQAAAGMPYLLQHSADLKAWTNIANVTADASGVCARTVTLSGNAYFRYAYETPPPL